MPARLLTAALALLCLAAPAAAQSKVVILSTTTSTQDSGLLDVLVPMFEQQTGYTVKTISVGTGQALALAARGEADVTLAHAPEVEKKYVAEGRLLNRRLVGRDDQVAVHANVQAGHRRMRRALDTRVAVKTLNLILARVQLMRKRDRLLGCEAAVVTDRSPFAS